MLTRGIRLVTFESAAPPPAAAGTQFCMYLDGRTDTPETGPLPCDTSRRYMLGTSSLGTRAPADSTFGNGSVEGSGPLEGTLASPPTPDSNFDRNTDIQAP